MIGRHPMRTDTIFRVMSMSKPITGVGVMILVDDGLLALSDPMEKHLPEYRGKNSSRSIRVRDLMTHASGMPGGSPETPRGPRGNWDHSLAQVVGIEAQMQLAGD